MSEELERIKSDYLTKFKKLKLLEAGVDISGVDKYVKYINAADEKEIEKQVAELITDIERHNTAKLDKKTWRPF